ncbi:MAG: hypothetical protein ACI9N1_000217 [Flavobacteriales bacterium]|jgi:hypothetical protein
MDLDINIFDYTGRLVFDKEHAFDKNNKKLEVNLSEYSNGYYSILLANEGNNFRHTRSIIKE